MKSYDVIVIGAGVVGASVAFHLAALGARNVLVLDRGAIGAGTTAQSSGILRTHYSVRENVELARRSWVRSPTLPPTSATTTPPAAWCAAAT